MGTLLHSCARAMRSSQITLGRTCYSYINKTIYNSLSITHRLQPSVSVPITHSLTSPHLTSPHLTSPHLTSPHLSSSQVSSFHLKYVAVKRVSSPWPWPIRMQLSRATHVKADNGSSDDRCVWHGEDGSASDEPALIGCSRGELSCFKATQLRWNEAS